MTTVQIGEHQLKVPPNSFLRLSYDDAGQMHFVFIQHTSLTVDALWPHIPEECKLLSAFFVAEWSSVLKKWGELPVNDCKNFDTMADCVQEAREQIKLWQALFDEGWGE